MRLTTLLAISVALLDLTRPASFAAPAADYVPVGEGNEWVMDAEISQPGKLAIKATGRRKSLERVQRDGKTYVRVKTSMEGAPFKMEFTKLLRKDESGLFAIDERDKEGKEQLEMLLPLKIGSSWEMKAGDKVVKEKIVGIESVTTGGKTYEECFHIHAEAADGAVKEDYWEAPVAGTVKSLIVYSNGNRISLTLREFKSGK